EVLSDSGSIGIHANNVTAQSSGGIVAQSNAGANVSIETTDAISSAFSNGIAAFAGAGSINVNVLSGSITSGAAGIMPTPLNGPTYIANFGTITGLFAGIDAESTGAGSITVTNAGSVIATGPAGAVGIFVETNSGAAVVNSTGDVTASRGIEVQSTSGSIGIH